MGIRNAHRHTDIHINTFVVSLFKLSLPVF